jgi:uncharacterized protein YebE (UPF0316 family)
MVKEYNSKHAFWQALVFAVVVFSVGMIFGFFLETSRADRINANLINSELNILDDQLRNEIVRDRNVRCDLALESTFQFADKIYNEAVQLERYDSSSKFVGTLTLLHKRYDLLRAVLWMGAVDLKERCDGDFHTVVYLYNYNVQDVEINSKQRFYSGMLLDLKYKYPDQILLIPIAANMDLSSVALLADTYGVTQFPSIIVDEERIISDIITFEEFEKIVFGNLTRANQSFPAQ